MTSDNPQNQPDPREPQHSEPVQPDASKTPPPRKRRWLRRMLIGVGIVVLVLVILLILAPTIISMGWARSIAVNKINQNLNGHVQIANWSLGWTSGIKVDGIKVFDDQNRQVLEIPHVSTQLSLLNAARGNYALGQTVVDSPDFNIVRYPDGTTNLQKLKKAGAPATTSAPSGESPSSASAGKPAPVSNLEKTQKEQQPTKLPNVSGELKLVNGRGTVETISLNSKTNQEQHDMVKFTSIQGDVKIPNINQAITDSIQIVEVPGDSSQSGTLSINGQLLVAKNNQMLDATQISGNQDVTLSGIELAGFAPFAPPTITALAGNTNGKITLNLTPGAANAIEGKITSQNFKLGGPIVSGDTYAATSAVIDIHATRDNDRLTVSPNLELRDVVLHTADGDDSIGLVALSAKQLALLTNTAQQASGTKQSSTMDQIREVQVAQLTASIPGAQLTVNGSILDPGNTRRFQNMGADLTYDASKLWTIIYPMLSKKSQEDFKDAKVAGSYTKHIAIDGSYPNPQTTTTPGAKQPIESLFAAGDLTIDQFDASGATLAKLDLPFVINKGYFVISIVGKPAGQDMPQPATLNGGTLDLGGIFADLKDPHLRLTAPNGKKLLDNVSLNPAFARLFGDWINNPMFVTADNAAGQLDITINQCTAFPLDKSVMDRSPSNTGVMDLSMVLNRVQLGNQMMSNISQQMQGILGNGIALQSLQGDIPKLHVHIEHGITKEEMTMTFGQGRRPLNLTGDVVMDSRQMNMVLDLPADLLGIGKSSQQLSFLNNNGIQIPLGGTVEHPEFDAGKAVQANFSKAPQDLIKGLLNSKGDNNQNQPTSKPSKEKDNNPLDQLQDLLNRNKKKK